MNLVEVELRLVTVRLKVVVGGRRSGFP